VLHQLCSPQDVRYYRWANEREESQMISDLRQGIIRALVLDSPWVKYTTSENCDLFTTGDLVLPAHLVRAGV
jgi:hypothetical protein